MLWSLWPVVGYRVTRLYYGLQRQLFGIKKLDSVMVFKASYFV